VLALFTDGLVESPGADIDDAVAGLAARLARADEPTLDALADSLLQHRATPHTDDIALLVLRVGPSGPGVPGR
jgi:serine phosphatase RsbU (regulator of sigma subunit)